MKRKIYIPIVLTLLLTTLDGKNTLARTSSSHVAIVSKVNGKVEVKRKKSSQYKQIKENEGLYSGDLLRVQKGSKGIIRCTSNSTTWTIPDDGLPIGVANTCSRRKS
jgi:hypothetical protein